MNIWILFVLCMVLETNIVDFKEIEKAAIYKCSVCGNEYTSYKFKHFNEFVDFKKPDFIE